MDEEGNVWPPPPIRPPPPKPTRCPNCGADSLPEETTVCPICSVSLDQSPPPLFVLLSGFVGLLMMTVCGVASSFLAGSGGQVLLFLMVGGAFTGLVLLAFAFVAAHWAGRKRR